MGFLDKTVFLNFKFPSKIPLAKTIHDCLEKNIDKKYYYNDKSLYQKIKNDITKKDTIYQWRRQYVRENKNNVCPTLTANMGMGGHNVSLVLDDKGIRKLIPRECANFQGFPKDYKLPKIADSQLYKQFGNSVVVSVVSRIVKNIKIALEKNMNEYYDLKFEDFKRVFEFGINYYIEPSKNKYYQSIKHNKRE